MFGDKPLTRELLRPLHWYVQWTRDYPNKSRSLERMTQTFAMIMSNPADLINMECCWTASKVHAFINQTIIGTGGRRVDAAETISLLLRGVKEMESLMELILRKVKGHAVAWDVLLGLEVIKCMLNLAVHHRLLLVPWMWRSLRLTLCRMLHCLSPLRLFSSPGASSRAAPKTATVVGPGGVPLVIPRVVSSRRHLRRLAPDGGEEEEAVPVTWLDLLCVVLDAVILLRPLMLLATARRVFPKGPEMARIGVVPSPMTDAAAAAAAAEGETPAASEGTEAAHYADVIRFAMAATADQTLFSNWRAWASFATLDAVVLFFSYVIRHYRVPIVYVDEEEGGRGPQPGGGADGAVADAGAEREEFADGRPPLPPVPADAAAAGDEADGEEEAADAARRRPVQPVPVPAVVSRDALRVQHAMRNMALSFLRDPFFTATLRYYVHKYLVVGCVNRIPLLGSLLAFQVSYILSMQHFSFMYSLGQ